MNTIENMQTFFTTYQYTLPLIGVLPIGKILFAIGIFIVTNILFWTIRRVILVQLQKISDNTDTNFDDMLVAAVQSIHVWVYSVVSIYAAIHIFTLPTWLEKTSLFVFLFALVWQVIEIAVCVVGYMTSRMVRNAATENGDSADLETMRDLINMIARGAFWLLGGIFVLANLGVNITSLVAGLGIGGIAVAFALQGVLADLFASFSIYFDRPFSVGDFIVIGTDMGTVEKIGIKSTRIKTLQGEELIVSNTELTSARVQNFKRMEERRIVGRIGITYETNYELVEQVPKLIEETLQTVPNARFDRAHFTEFGDSALVFEFVYFIESPEMVVYLDAQNEFNYKLVQKFSAKGIGFAYPTQMQYTKVLS